MTEYIGGVPIASIQNVEVNRSFEVNEVDLKGDNTNIVLNGNDEGWEISIDFTLVSEDHLNSQPLREQKDEVRSLVSQPVTENAIVYSGFAGFISVTNVDIPESGSSDTIIQGSIDGLFLPWPKHHPQKNQPGTEMFGRLFGVEFGG